MKDNQNLNSQSLQTLLQLHPLAMREREREYDFLCTIASYIIIGYLLPQTNLQASYLLFYFASKNKLVPPFHFFYR